MSDNSNGGGGARPGGQDAHLPQARQSHVPHVLAFMDRVGNGWQRQLHPLWDADYHLDTAEELRQHRDDYEKNGQTEVAKTYDGMMRKEVARADAAIDQLDKKDRHKAAAALRRREELFGRRQ